MERHSGDGHLLRDVTGARALIAGTSVPRMLGGTDQTRGFALGGPR